MFDMFLIASLSQSVNSTANVTFDWFNESCMARIHPNSLLHYL